MSRGGARSGAGRKTDGEAPRVSITARVAKDTADKLRRMQGQDGLGRLIDAIVRKI